jgi:hypothetical protein
MTDPYLTINETPVLWAVMLTFARSVAKQSGVDAEKLLDDVTDNAVWYSSWAEGKISDDIQHAYAMRIGQLLRAITPQPSPHTASRHKLRDGLPTLSE